MKIPDNLPCWFKFLGKDRMNMLGFMVIVIVNLPVSNLLKGTLLMFIIVTLVLNFSIFYYLENIAKKGQ